MTTNQVNELTKILGLDISNSTPYVPIVIILGAVPGAISRYYLTLLFGRLFGTNFPYGTFFINLTGTFLMGFFTTLASKLHILSYLQILVTVGFLSSYTTFSTYALDTLSLLRTGNYKNTILYYFGSPMLGFIIIELGILLANMIYILLYNI